MSGIAGIVNFDGAPVDRSILDRMAAILEMHGTDRTGRWSDDSIGLFHTLFATTDEAARERQPSSLDGQVWLTADARIDGREDLIRELRGHGCACSASSTDPELILHAYSVWGEECVDHLLGDFAFAIWDAAGRKLFCARDHFGAKPFFYVQAGNSFFFSNILDCLRVLPGASDELDEQFIADFLLFELSPDFDRTAFRAIRRLPPANLIVANRDQVSLRRYWRLPAVPLATHKRSRDYVERFRELFDQAVSDRLRTNRVGILMSGGLDSTSVAATAKKVSQQSGNPVELTAHPTVYDRLISHPERHYAEIAAKGMGIPIQCFVADDYGLFDGWEEGELHFSEPVNNPLALSGLHHLRGIAQGARVVLTGFGGDPALSSRISRHVRELARQRRYGRLALDVGRYLAAEGRLSRLYLGGRFRRLSSRRGPGIFPEWLNPELENRLNLRRRWQSFTSDSPAEGAVRPEAHSALHSPVWSYTFEGWDAGATGVALEARHPFFDLRLLRYLLSLPALPWCSDKEILRVAMKGYLPEQVRLRRKTPMVNHPYVALRKDVARTLQERFFPVPELSRFVRPERLLNHIDNDQTSWISLVATLRPVSLNFWLKTRSALA